MKYALFLLMSLVIIMTGCAFLGGKVLPTMTDEVYEGSASGYRGQIHVQVRTDRGSITEIVVLDSEEDRFVGEVAMQELIDMVIEYNSTDLDAVSGATVTSKGFLEAVNNAILGL